MTCLILLQKSIQYKMLLFIEGGSFVYGGGGGLNNSHNLH